ncbi:RpiB/LacA/LacB family sugar-phosphate isomerase [Paractinoplanes globisporus]|uniref:RpiB/LacA/LacB family sugar-phosphate isomerase n=1 Tax=Paractinoplanes globisporus TaxID=113565 RepID=A0ABW6W8G4_9ACTN|nr:RpiB/LacA/LacB family sugar-phosphate isomerase [Actinoplanes globisporus]
MRIAIAADHNGVALKTRLIDQLTSQGHAVDDRGTHSDEVVDYPALCVDVGHLVAGGAADRGIIVGGSGQGEHIACNKLHGIRAGLGFDRFTTEISRLNNDSNMLILGAKVISAELALELADLWLTTAFRGGIHQRRVDAIMAIEEDEAYR